MPQYLSDEWFADMTSAGLDQPIDSVGELSLREIVTGTPYGDVSYVLHISDGNITFNREEANAQVTFTQSYDTAVQLHKGDMTIHDAFFAGKVRVSGHLNTLLEHSDLLQGLGPKFESVRTTTTY